MAGGLNFHRYAPNPTQWVDPFGRAARRASGGSPALIGDDYHPDTVNSRIQNSPYKCKGRKVSYPDKKAGQYTCICRANKDGRSEDNRSIDNQEYAMGEGSGASLGEAKNAAESDAKDKLGAKSTHHIQCRCRGPNGDKIIPHG